MINTLQGHLLHTLPACLTSAQPRVRAVRGDLGTSAPLAPATVMRPKPYSLFWKTDIYQEHGLQRQRDYFFKLCHKQYHVVREGKELSGLLLIVTDDFLTAVSNTPSFFRILARGLGTEADGNGAHPSLDASQLKRTNNPAPISTKGTGVERKGKPTGRARPPYLLWLFFLFTPCHRQAHLFGEHCILSTPPLSAENRTPR